MGKRDRARADARPSLASRPSPGPSGPSGGLTKKKKKKKTKTTRANAVGGGGGGGGEAVVDAAFGRGKVRCFNGRVALERNGRA